MFCQKCGTDIGDSAFCPQCGTPAGQQVAQKSELGMKWYKTLKVLLILGFISNIVSGLGYITGTIYASQSNMRVTAEMVYATFGPALKITDVVFGVIFIGIAVFQLFVFKALSNYKVNAPKMVVSLYVAMAATSLLYGLISSAIAGSFSISIPGIAGYVIMAVANNIYFGNRKHLFINE